MEYGIGEARGDQMAFCECYIAMLEMDDHFQGLNTEEKKLTVELTRDLEQISLYDDTPGWTTHISTQVDPLVRKEFALFLKTNQDVFT